jgi:hypothetical protein
MTRRHLLYVLGGWALAVAVGSVTVHGCARIDRGPLPSERAGRWARQALEAARLGQPPPSPPEDARAFRAAGPIFVIAWWHGSPIGRHVEDDGNLVEAIENASAAFARDGLVSDRPAWRAPRGEPGRVRFTVTIVEGEGPILLGLPFLENLGVVPLHEGLVGRLSGRTSFITPEELRARGAYDGGVPLPIPDSSFGVDVRGLIGRLARDLGVEPSELLADGEVRRFRATTLDDSVYPRPQPVTEDNLRRAAVEGAEFLLRHQHPDGRFTYIYEVHSGVRRLDGYNVPRHSGATYYLAQVHNLHGMPEARAGALRALRYVRQQLIRECGPERIWCVAEGGIADVGSAALTVVAAAEALETGDDPVARDLVDNLSAFLRSLQREDGELMHEYDLRENRPIDVQHMYYSGEAALALLTAHRMRGNPENLEAARRLMRHLAEESWSFFGSRYYYGEEHWTCMAANEAAGRMDVSSGLDFCMRWANWNRTIQIRPGETPWNVRGAYGVGPGLIVPRLTPVGSRSEAMVSTYLLAKRMGVDPSLPRQVVEEGLASLLRWRLAPGPEHLLADPLGARGGMPGSPVDLDVRNDFVQHGCSAMLRWADVLHREAESGEGR